MADQECGIARLYRQSLIAFGKGACEVAVDTSDISLAGRIVAERARAPFKSVDDLHRVSGIAGKKLEELRPHVTIGTTDE